MPELPEVETIKRQLAKVIVGMKVVDVAVRFGGRLNLATDEFIGKLKNKKIINVDRRAKLLLFHLSGGTSMVAHLKMSGKFLLHDMSVEPTKHSHVVFKLSDGKNLKQLFFEDVRKFGFLKIFQTSDLEKKVFSFYGPEPVDKKFSFTVFQACLKTNGPKKIKAKLLDQTCIAGIGNIYADESCFYARVQPERLVLSLNAIELKQLHQGIVKNLESAINSGGSSVDTTDTYVDAHGQKGRHRIKLNVYGREGESCRRCTGVVLKIRLGGRGTHFCPQCQK